MDGWNACFVCHRAEKLEYEGLQQLCFSCGVYGHSQDSFRAHGVPMNAETDMFDVVDEPELVISDATNCDGEATISGHAASVAAQHGKTVMKMSIFSRPTPQVPVTARI
ncbi:hypothetical protein V6N12_056196 [Hibiscus sabdariffa]|uniref:Uncharacterized protein n=1 Tax=Hibiscus sabdariffa TaxID=183260 RepID=A0ABR2CRT2_9ROSI